MEGKYIDKIYYLSTTISVIGHRKIKSIKRESTRDKMNFTCNVDFNEPGYEDIAYHTLTIRGGILNMFKLSNILAYWAFRNKIGIHYKSTVIPKLPNLAFLKCYSGDFNNLQR